MGPWRLIITSLLAAALLSAATASAWTVRELNATIASANFIVAKGCSGTLISLKYRLILTNHHCIGSGVSTQSREFVDDDGVVSRRKVEVLRDLNVTQRAYVGHRLVGESSHKSEIVARWREGDLALLQIRADIPNDIAARVFAGDEILRGEGVYVVGNPLGLDATVTRGIVSNTTRMFRVSWANNAEVSFIQVDAGMSPGNSGGALFNNTGELIGVPAAGIPGNGHLGLVIPVFAVQEFLTENCYGEVWNTAAPTWKTCVAEKEATAGEKENDNK